MQAPLLACLYSPLVPPDLHSTSRAPLGILLASFSPQLVQIYELLQGKQKFPLTGEVAPSAPLLVRRTGQWVLRMAAKSARCDCGHLLT